MPGERDAAGRVYRRRREDTDRDERDERAERAADGPAPIEAPGGMFVGLPIWARVIGLVGIPGSIALFAVWFGSQSIPKLQTEVTTLREVVQRQNALSEQILARGAEHTRLLQKICSAQFPKEEDKQRCFDR